MSTFSNEHIKYIKKLRKEKIVITFFRVFILLFFLLIWEVLSKLNIINSFLSSSPSNVLKTIVSLINDGSIFKHISVTLYEVLISFSISFTIGFIISCLFWWSDTCEKIFDPYITILNSLPKVALGPLIIIWVGASTNSIIFMSLLISTFITIIDIYNGFISTDIKYITLMKSFKASKYKIFRKVVLPYNYINLINTLKINASMTLIGVIMGELLVSKEGLGYLIMYGSQVFNINLVITSVVLLGVISYLMYFIINLFQEFYLKKMK